MGYEKRDRMSDDNSKYVPKETVKDVLEYPFRGLAERGVRKDTCEKFQVRAGVSEVDGKTVEAFYFPSYNQKGVLTGYKKQNLLLDKSEKGHWTTIGTVSIGNKMFAQQQAEGIQRKHGTLTVTEGEWDTLSSVQACLDQVKGTKYEGIEPFIVSIPLGTGAAVESVLHNTEFVASFTDLQIMFDDDFCTPGEKAKSIMKGHEAREAVASALIGTGINLFVVEPPQGFKDASDLLQAGKSDELAKLIQFGKKPYQAEKIVQASSVTFEEMMTKRPDGIMSSSFPELNKKLHGFRRSELVVLTAPSNVGKSFVTADFAYDFLAADEKVAMLFLEETTKETLMRIVARRLSVNFNLFKDNPSACASEEAIREAYDWATKEDRLYFLDHFGSMPVNDLLSKINNFHKVNGVRWLILDHLSLVISGSAVADERKELDLAMTSLATYCAANDIGIIVVAHLNRGVAAEFKAPKGSEDKPFFVSVGKEMMRGSASLEQLAWIVLSLEPEIMPDKSRGRARIGVLKNRPFGYLGIADVFKMDDETGRLVSEGSNSYSF